MSTFDARQGRMSRARHAIYFNAGMHCYGCTHVWCVTDLAVAGRERRHGRLARGFPGRGLCNFGKKGVENCDLSEDSHSALSSSSFGVSETKPECKRLSVRESGRIAKAECAPSATQGPSFPSLSFRQPTVHNVHVHVPLTYVLKLGKQGVVARGHHQLTS